MSKISAHKCLLDSDILSEITKGVDPNVVNNANLYLSRYEALTFTSISVYEILWGYKAKPAPIQAQRFLQLAAVHDEIVPEGEDYRLAASIRAALKIAGKEIGRADPVIAACAVRRNLVLITGNTRHYQFVVDVGFPLVMDNWREA